MKLSHKFKIAYLADEPTTYPELRGMLFRLDPAVQVQVEEKSDSALIITFSDGSIALLSPDDTKNTQHSSFV
jgi:hypothetical protein